MFGAIRLLSSHFSARYADQFVQLLPMFLRDALGDVRVQARKCYWAFHHVFPVCTLLAMDVYAVALFTNVLLSFCNFY